MPPSRHGVLCFCDGCDAVRLLANDLVNLAQILSLAEERDCWPTVENVQDRLKELAGRIRKCR